MKKACKSFKVFLPQLSAYEIEQLGLLTKVQNLISIEPLTQDWQSQFCEAIAYPQSDLPWTQLRLAQFKIPHSTKIACCIDPVMIKLTHKGAYMVGQDQLNLSPNDAIRIVAQINERLMDEGENLYLVDRHSWLFTSDKSLTLSSQSIQSLIGKDLFNFPYGGDSGHYWQNFSMEIQMLIKQMIDYQGLPASPPETMLNVHCFDLVNIEEKETIPFINNSTLSVLSTNEMIKTFCCKTFLAYKDFSEHQGVSDFNAENNVLIGFDSEKELYPKFIQAWSEVGLLNNNKCCQIICQDAVIQFKSRPGLFKSWFGIKF